jgi:hypothetical protein
VFESKLVYEMKGEILMLVLETADGFRGAIDALRSTEEHKFSHLFAPEDRCKRVLIRNLGLHKPKVEIREKMCRRSCNSDRKDRIKTPRRTVP